MAHAGLARADHCFVKYVTPNNAKSHDAQRFVRSHAARTSAAQAKATRAAKRTSRLSENAQYSSLERKLYKHFGPLAAFLGNDRLVPASASPVYHEPFIPLVINNYLTNLAVAIPEIDGPEKTFLLRTVWFSAVIHSPAIFQVIVLFSASHYAAQHHDIIYAPTILALKQYALAGIASLVTSTEDALSDELIAVIAKMASYEAIYGLESVYHTHMKAVSRIILSRGGLAALGLDGLLARLLAFIDTNSAFLLKTHLYFRESPFPLCRPSFSHPNPGQFIGAS